jgi:eukaryotic-like serine/threonine-protein kinase
LVALPAPGAPTTTPPQTTPRKIKLESMIGRNKAEATTQLANVGLKANIRETVVMAGQPLGVVVDQQPRPKEDAPVFVDAGSSVELVVSVEAPAQPTALGAPDKVKVPADLVGLRFEEAREKLQDVNLGVKRVDDPAGNLPEGQVIRLEPAEGSEVPVLTEVQVVVSARILADGNDLG